MEIFTQVTRWRYHQLLSSKEHIQAWESYLRMSQNVSFITIFQAVCTRLVAERPGRYRHTTRQDIAVRVKVIIRAAATISRSCDIKRLHPNTWSQLQFRLLSSTPLSLHTIYLSPFNCFCDSFIGRLMEHSATGLCHVSVVLKNDFTFP